jgi:5-methylcytosine-specific restriction endonuclease McrA
MTSTITRTCTACGGSAAPSRRGLCNRCYQAVPARAARGRAQALTWYHSNKDRARETERARLNSDAASRERKRQRNRESYARHREIRLAKVLARQQAHPEQTVARTARYRALTAKAPGAFTAAEFATRVAEFGGRCAYCLRPYESLAAEHMTPLSWPHGSSNSIENIVPACKRCNSSKGSKNLLLFLHATNGIGVGAAAVG